MYLSTYLATNSASSLCAPSPGILNAGSRSQFGQVNMVELAYLSLSSQIKTC